MGITPKDVADLDQANKTIVDTFPKFWWGLYKENMDAGFTETQALELVVAFIQRPT